MSHPAVEIDGSPQMDHGADVPLTAPGAARQQTGDQDVDDVLDKLDKASEEPLDTQIEVSELVHQVLQGRLADLGKE